MASMQVDFVATEQSRGRPEARRSGSSRIEDDLCSACQLEAVYTGMQLLNPKAIFRLEGSLATLTEASSG